MDTQPQNELLEGELIDLVVHQEVINAVFWMRAAKGGGSARTDYCRTLGTGPGFTERTERGNRTRNVVPVSEVRSTITEPM